MNARFAVDPLSMDLVLSFPATQDWEKKKSHDRDSSIGVVKAG